MKHIVHIWFTLIVRKDMENWNPKYWVKFFVIAHFLRFLICEIFRFIHNYCEKSHIFDDLSAFRHKALYMYLFIIAKKETFWDSTSKALVTFCRQIWKSTKAKLKNFIIVLSEAKFYRVEAYFYQKCWTDSENWISLLFSMEKSLYYEYDYNKYFITYDIWCNIIIKISFRT